MNEKEQDISPEVFEHLVKLAALELDEEQAAYLRRELNLQLGAIRELAAIELDVDVPAALHGVPYDATRRPPLRQDAWQACEEAEAIMRQAPQFEGGYLVVPDIPHTTLE